MKQFGKYVPFLMLVMAFTFNACSEDQNINTEDFYLKSSNTIYVASDFEFIGVQHNEILADFLSNNSNLNNSENKLDYVKDFILNAVDTGTETENILSNELNNYIRLTNNNESFYPQGLEGMNELAKQFFDEFYTVFYEEHIHNKNYTMENVINRKISEIENLEKRIENSELNNDWRAVLFSSTNVGKYSLRYWMDNYENWKNNPNNSAFQLKCGIGGCYTDDIIDIAGMDVAGAATGATYALIVNVIPGPGQAAYGTAILATAVSSSLGAAVKKIWDWAW
jgi:hypothetical protein